jgi:methionyl-tRNA synthetase
MRKILITCALPYSNGEIHLGHLVEYLQADIWVRFQKMRGHNCLFFCADDTHGTPVMIAAKQQNITPQKLIEKKKIEHLQDFNKFEINFTYYSNTNSLINQKLVNEIYQQMKQKKHIHIKEVKQAFCNHCQMFLPDRFIKGTCPNCNSLDQYGDSCDNCGATYSSLEVKNAYCITCKNPPQTKNSQHVFFKLSDYQDFLSHWIINHMPYEVSKKLKEWFGKKLKDWDISRDTPYFGFPIPDCPDKFFYVWVDAPIGYIATTEEWCQQNSILQDSFKNYWQNPDWEIYHFIGKDIIYFHGLFWPAMLKCAKLTTPKYLFVHGFITVNGEKISKSKKTFINASSYLQHLSPLYLRYYFASKISSAIVDINFSWDDFKYKINNELLSKITNIASRCLQMLHKKLDGKIGKISHEGKILITQAKNQEEKIATYYENRDFAKMIIMVRNIAESTNRYLDKKSPWKMNLQTQTANVRSVLTDGLNLFRIIVVFLSPVLPSYSKKVSDFFQESLYSWDSINEIKENQEMLPYHHLISKIELKNLSDLFNN